VALLNHLSLSADAENNMQLEERNCIYDVILILQRTAKTGAKYCLTLFAENYSAPKSK
jgi:hypothetical protein